MNCRPRRWGDGAGNVIPQASNVRADLDEEGENSRITGVPPMRTSRIEKRQSWPIIWLATAVAVIAAGCTNSDAGTRKAALMKAASAAPAPQEKPVKLRYYGGPKSPRYPE
jgi:hypothetical protein